ncbi:efflux RND transporter periplasmic adaptor subunit [uncultured Shewanella sp.]|uniref:efflux RND transporter periplasmic adaptor subunit n=1 Tax=uncultured Shewanella sp. TaxID=173975 RepID=UPI00260D6E0E|nr:efflux RND transporter periplasmic adaptor subunit [uncultured Shewanella sp.]
MSYKLPIIIFMSVLLIACGQQPRLETDPRIQPPFIPFVAVQPDVSQERTFSGTVEAQIQSDLSFRIAGKILERQVNTGEYVKKGQVLMRLDTKDLFLELTSANKAVEAAKADVFKAKSDERRKRQLVDEGYVSKQDYDYALATLKASKAQLAMARAKASIAEHAMEYSALVANADGVIVNVTGEAGQVVTAGQPMMTLAQDGPRDAVVRLPETIHPALGTQAKARFYNANIPEGDAYLRELSNAADVVTRTYEARFKLNGKHPPLLGSTVSVTLTLPAAQGSFIVPIDALYNDGQGSGVWVLNKADSRVTFRRVSILRMNTKNASVRGALKLDEFIAANGAHRLHENELVAVLYDKQVVQ